MGGRGTFAFGDVVPRRCETVDRVGDIKVHEFVDRLSLGEELLVEYGGARYFAQGWGTAGGAHMELTTYGGGAPRLLWERDARDMAACARALLDAPLWDGATFADAEERMTWSEDW